MGIKDVAKRAAEKATPAVKDKAADAGRMASNSPATVTATTQKEAGSPPPGIATR